MRAGHGVVGVENVALALASVIGWIRVVTRFTGAKKLAAAGYAAPALRRWRDKWPSDVLRARCGPCRDRFDEKEGDVSSNYLRDEWQRLFCDRRLEF